jgi:hypothetical protein
LAPERYMLDLVQLLFQRSRYLVGSMWDATYEATVTTVQSTFAVAAVDHDDKYYPTVITVQSNYFCGRRSF